MKKTILAAALAAAILSLQNCASKGDNPFDDIDRPIDSTGIDQPFDTASISGLHRFILKEKCAIPSCHGGTFEPDFRTPQSAWSTLVWAPVIKNTDDYRFQFRVIPGNVNESWLHERCVTDDPILGRMPRYADPLSATELFYLKKWIADGAKDINGQPAPPSPNLNARIYDMVALGPNNTRLDTVRAAFDEPFSMPKSTDVYLIPAFYDNETPTEKLLDTKLKVSLDANFSTFKDLPLTFVPQFGVWLAQVNTGLWPSGSLVYMRVEMRDTDHQAVAKLPSALSPVYMVKHFSFKVE